MVKWGCAVGALIVGALPVAAQAQGQDPQQEHAPTQGTPAPVDPAAPAVPQSQPAAPQGEADSVGAQPQATPTASSDSTEEEPTEEVVVTGQLEGAVPGDVKPELQLGPGEIRGYGASNVSELIAALAPQLGSGSGRGDEAPVILLSGRRANLGEVRSLPAEAIERVDILPEEAALKYGYSANQKVINIVLRRFYQALTAEAEGRAATDGGNAGGRIAENITLIRPSGTLVIDGRYDQSSGILESERGVSRAGTSLFDTRGNITGLASGAEIDPALSAAAGGLVSVVGVPEAAAGGAQGVAAFVPGANTPNVTDVRPYRTLTAPQRNLDLNAVYTPNLLPKVRTTANLQYQASETESLQGLPGVSLLLPAGSPFSPFGQNVQLLRTLDDPLQRRSDSQSFTGTLNANGDGTPWGASWNWSVVSSYQRTTRHSTTDTGLDPLPIQAEIDALSPSFNPFAAIPGRLIVARPDDVSNSRNSVARVEALTSGALFKLPAGDARASLRVQGQTIDQSSETVRLGVPLTAGISRDSASARGNLDLPITSSRRAVLGAIGDLSLNGNFEIEQLSDFGRLTSIGYGFNWSPIRAIRANIRWSEDSNAPSPGQLADPLLITPNVRAFDAVRGESVDITTITGGNPALRADSRHVFNARLNIRPFTETNLSIDASYTNQRLRNTTGELPGLTAAVEAAFPDRFTRDASGRLISVDFRPINFARTEREQLRWGFNFFHQLASPGARRRQEEFAAFRRASAEARRTGQPLPAEVAERMEQMRRLGFGQSIFGASQRGQGQGGAARAPREGQAQPQGQEQTPAAAPRPGEGSEAPGAGRFGGPGRGGPGGGGFRGGGGGRGGGNRLDFSLYHNWVFKDQQLIRAGLPVLDRLNGAAGSRPAHSIEANGGVSYEGYRLRLNTTWTSATFVNAGALGSTDRLNFGSIAKVNLTAQVDFGQQFETLLRHPWLRATRVTLGVENLFNARQRITDETGATPPNYDPLLRDPVGRVIRLNLRKQFN